MREVQSVFASDFSHTLSFLMLTYHYGGASGSDVETGVGAPPLMVDRICMVWLGEEFLN